MTLRIETAARGKSKVFILSGRIETQAIAELRRLFGLQVDYREIVIDGERKKLRVASTSDALVVQPG
jgi:hypothetical protein